MEYTEPAIIQKPPVLVRLIALLYLVAGLFAALSSITFFIFGAQYGILSPFAKYGTTGAISVLAFAIIAYFMSRGLRRGYNWARRIAIILSIVSILVAAYQNPSFSSAMIVQLVINLGIVLYLLFSRRVKMAFKKTI
jgi:hypothetical protein